MRLPSTDHVELTVHDLGGHGGDALLCHATGFHGLVWAPLASHLHGLHAWAPDFRGHGASVTPPGYEFSWDRFADDVLACVDGLGLDHPIGIGHSKGGA
ncbi:MAG TPA: alpha/beta fold hydrolase, partial [Acidimicrobiales bacterium]